MAEKRIVCFGELLIDMIATTPGSLVEAEGFLKKFGGAPANTACGLAKLGIPVDFLGKVGNDPFGLFLKQELDNNNVGTEHLILSDGHKTTLAFVSLTESGERDFTFYRGAHEAIKASEVSLPDNTAVFHFGSLTQTNDTVASATQSLVDQAKTQGTTISYDPNIRESLWGDLEKAKKIILTTAKTVDILKINETEAEMLSRKSDPKQAATKLFTDNLVILFITLGHKGCFYKTRQFEGTVPSITVDAVDTTGAGDAFNAGFLAGLFGANKGFDDMTQTEIETIIKRATIIGALTTTKKGALTAFPTRSEIDSHFE